LRGDLPIAMPEYGRHRRLFIDWVGPSLNAVAAAIPFEEVADAFFDAFDEIHQLNQLVVADLVELVGGRSTSRD